MGFLKEFKTFAMKGNILDLATAVIVGGAFGKIVSSLVSDVVMPPIGLLLGSVRFDKLKLVLQAAKKNGETEIAEVSINYGAFIQTVVDFTIIAFVIFLVLKAYNKIKKKEEEAPAPPAEPSQTEVLLTEIRDLLKNGKA